MLQSVAARDPERARALAAEHGFARADDSYETLIASPDIDLVYVATPPALHAELVGQLAHAQTQDWFARTQAALQGHGLDALRAAQWAQAWLEGTVSQQALLLASDDLYRMIAGLAVAGIVLVLCQRRVH